MIYLILQDGLGNQMFQYAFARYLQEKRQKQGFGDAIELCSAYMDKKQDRSNTRRTMSLQHFVLNDTVCFTPRHSHRGVMHRFVWRTIVGSGLKELFRNRVLRLFDSTDALAAKRGRRSLYYPYGPHSNHPLTIGRDKDCFVFGFFQVYQYPEAVRHILKNEFIVKTPANKQNAELIAELENCNSVCVHIRRGDYMNPRWKNLQICDFDYYNRAINYIASNVSDPVFYIFSNTHDDIEWIRKNYHFQINGCQTPNVRYVDLENPDYEELRLMYTCRHFVISNSTFSWWGAWLSPNENKIVCMPQRWNLETKTDKHIKCPGWVCIDSQG